MSARPRPRPADPRPDARQVARELAAQALELCQTLFPAGRFVRAAREYEVGSLAGEAGRSLRIHIGGSKAGVWSDFSSGEAGDALDLVAAVLFAGDKAQAWRWALDWLGHGAPDGARLQETRRAVQAAATAPPADEEAAERHRAAQRIFLFAHPLPGTPAEAYLRGRAIDLRPLGKAPGAVRFHPRLWCAQLGTHEPAMVAGINGPDGRFLAVHRTYLFAQPDGRWTKHPELADAKLTLGTYAGGCIPLWRGASGKPWAHAPAGDRVAITEGIEDGLSVAVAAPELRVVAAVALANVKNLDLPAAVAHVTLCVDNDGDNAQAATAVRAAIDRFRAEGRTVRVARSAIGKDLNDALRSAQETPA